MIDRKIPRVQVKLMIHDTRFIQDSFRWGGILVILKCLFMDCKHQCKFFGYFSNFLGSFILAEKWEFYPRMFKGSQSVKEIVFELSKKNEIFSEAFLRFFRILWQTMRIFVFASYFDWKPVKYIYEQQLAEHWIIYDKNNNSIRLSIIPISLIDRLWRMCRAELFLSPASCTVT